MTLSTAECNKMGFKVHGVKCQIIECFRTLTRFNIVANSLSDHQPLRKEPRPSQVLTLPSTRREHAPQHVVVAPGRTNSDPEIKV